MILELSDCPPDYGAELGRYGPGMVILWIFDVKRFYTNNYRSLI
ncbi:hypothetical protein LPE509_00462 [Legionella pneumophila subsp. pneumophila LPE509]|nr:hypothetical protein LPE509_00462 [Legionella pneumophila subsp. pneumophila LPE509]